MRQRSLLATALTLLLLAASGADGQVQHLNLQSGDGTIVQAPSMLRLHDAYSSSCIHSLHHVAASLHRSSMSGIAERTRLSEPQLAAGFGWLIIAA